MTQDMGEKIRALRKSKNLTQTQLAQGIGVTKSMISAYENGSRCPSLEALKKIARFFGVSVDYLFGLTRPNSGNYLDISLLSRDDQRHIIGIVNSLIQRGNNEE